MYNNYDCSEYSVRILISPSSRPNSVLVFGRIVLQKTHCLRIIVAMRPPFVCSCTKPGKPYILNSYCFYVSPWKTAAHRCQIII